MYEEMTTKDRAWRGLSKDMKLQVSRSCTSSLTFWLSRIARYAPEPARPNLRHICDPGDMKI